LHPRHLFVCRTVSTITTIILLAALPIFRSGERHRVVSGTDEPLMHQLIIFRDDQLVPSASVLTPPGILARLQSLRITR